METVKKFSYGFDGHDFDGTPFLLAHPANSWV